MTFTNKAAREMSTRLSILTPSEHTRHVDRQPFTDCATGCFARITARRGYRSWFQIMDYAGPAGVIKRVYKAHNIDDDRYPVRQLQWFIAAAKEEGQRANMVEAGDEFTRRQVEHYALYEQACQREGGVDFPELLLRTYELLSRDDSLREHYRRRFSHILIDEFQDTNALQYKWLKLLAGTHAAIFAVGDDDQSIYAFRGANVANMQHFERDFSTADVPVKLIKLEQNYRSHGHILDAANALIKHNQGRLGKNLWSPTRMANRAGVRQRFRPGRGRVIVDVVKGLVEDNVSPAEIAVLYRSIAQSRVVEHALFNAAWPIACYGGMRFFRAGRGQETRSPSEAHRRAGRRRRVPGWW